MQLSKRLKTLADMVSKGSTVADVGCDHAYVSIYLMEQQIAKKVIAMDINKGPLKKARENIDSSNLSTCIETRLSNGLMELNKGEVDTVLIAGMGGSLIVSILSAREDIVNNVKELILSPQSEIFLVREYLRNHGYVIVEENMVKEDGKFYMMMKAIKNEEEIQVEHLPALTQSLYDRYGEYLLKHKNSVLKEFLYVELTKRKNIKKRLMEKPQEYEQRLKELENDIEILEGGLSYYAM